MQYKVFTIPAVGGETINEELNTFLRTRRVIEVDSFMVSAPKEVIWTFCIKYLESPKPIGYSKDKPRVDYREVLDEGTFVKFSKLREVRKQIAQEEAVPAYAIFTDEELSKIAMLSDITPANLKSIEGIGDKKVERYGWRFINAMHSNFEK